MGRSDNFKKFEKKPKGSAIKEKIRQDKKKEKRERAAAIEAHYARKREEKLRMQGIDPTATAKKARPAGPGNKYKSFAKAKAEQREAAGDKKPYEAKQHVSKKPSEIKKAKAARPANRNNETPHSAKQTRPYTERPFEKNKPAREEKKRGSSNKGSFKEFRDNRKPGHIASPTTAKQTGEKRSAVNTEANAVSARTAGEQMPLNKFIAHSGVCARRDAAQLVKDGKVTVNGTTITDPGTKVTEADDIKLQGKKITVTKNFVHILLNKPKDFITTAEDPQGRKTVLDLVRTATEERVYPVGRLDRNTSGVLLLTNDGDLAQKLSHPKHEIKKVYEVKLDRPLTKTDMEKIAAGITLEDGFVAPDVIAYADSKDKSIVGIEIHSGRNRIVRRIFEHLKYDVKALDRVMFAGLTKKDVLRGKWRFLKEKEVRLLKYMNQSFVKAKK